ncbi:MAG: ribosomal protein S18-alanine N-acetyltransferase [Faecalimonas sp.]|nr:ribosomal protein S18-alanine N-acetyltransferase [Faecalimonas sp.]
MQNIREMREADVDGIAELEQVYFCDAWSSKAIADTFRQKQAFVLVAEQAQEILGYAIVYYAADEAELVRIAVDKRYRRQGVGRALLDAVCAQCLEKQMQRLFLEVRGSNQDARALYRGYGFAEDGIRKNFYEEPREDAVLMSLVLAK